MYLHPVRAVWDVALVLPGCSWLVPQVAQSTAPRGLPVSPATLAPRNARRVVPMLIFLALYSLVLCSASARSVHTRVGRGLRGSSSSNVYVADMTLFPVKTYPGRPMKAFIPEKMLVAANGANVVVPVTEPKETRTLYGTYTFSYEQVGDIMDAVIGDSVRFVLLHSLSGSLMSSWLPFIMWAVSWLHMWVHAKCAPAGRYSVIVYRWAWCCSRCIRKARSLRCASIQRLTRMCKNGRPDARGQYSVLTPGNLQGMSRASL
jgi:hypothetical protein